jgi:flagellar L-ring protein precursor FlgH
MDPNSFIPGNGPGGLMPPGGFTGPGQPVPLPAGPLAPQALRRRDVSWIYIDRPKPRKVGVHDIITVIVDEKSEVTQNSRFNRQRNAVYTAQLKEWLRINSTGDLDVAAVNSPGINGQLRSQLQSFGTGLSQEGMKYRIAATVVDILPNGTLILEAHKSIRTNAELWEYSLTGRIRSQDVAGNNTVNSENIADLMIAKREHGKIQDSTKRGWLQRIYDFALPF